MPPHKQKRALVLPGGGVRGAFQVGALRYLLEELGLEYDIIVGVSVGALNGSFLAQYKKEDQAEAAENLNSIWLDIKDSRVKRHWFPLGFLQGLFKQSLYDSSPLENLVERGVDTEKLKNSGVVLRVGTTSLDSGNYVEFSESDPDIKPAVKASAAFPVFFKPVPIARRASRSEPLTYERYVDGGIREISPLSTAIKLGAEHITIINTGPLGMRHVRSARLGIFELVWRCLDIQSAEVLVNDLQEFIEINERLANKTLNDPTKRIIDYLYIEPDGILVDNPLKFDPKEIRKMILAGVESAKAAVEKKKAK